jgi:hypothetical protein
VDAAPEQEGPGGAVPEPAQQHREHQVAVGLEPPAAVAAERYVEVVAQPARQRHVPAPPEIAQRQRHVGTIEVLRQLVAEQQREADRHVGIAREVAVDLRREAVEGERELRGRVRVRVAVDRVDHAPGELVGDHCLLQHPADDQEDRGTRQHRARVARRAQLRQELVGPDDRPGHEMREERLEDRHVH